MLNEIESSKGLKPSGGLKPSSGIEGTKGLESTGGLASHKNRARKNIDDAFDSFMPEGQGGGGSIDSYPFRGYVKSVAGVPKIRIQNGDINSDVPPEVQGGSGPVDYDTDDYVYYVSAGFDVDGLYTGPVAVGRAASVPADTATVAYRRIFEVQSGEVLPSVQNSLEVVSCGVGVYSWGSV